MGTSSSYKGSTGKVGRALRDGVDEWADGQSDGQKTRIPEGVVAQALKIPVFSRRSSGGGGGGGGASGGGGGTGRKQSAPRRDARAYAATASRASNLARAFREGDREALAKAGLDFDSLSALPTRAEMVRAILDVVCEAQTSSDIPAEEQRDIAHHLLEWMLDTDVNPSTPDAAATAEHAIGVMIAEIFISESDEFTSTGSVSREDFIDEVYDTSHHLAARANLSETGASPDAIDTTIERGLRYLRRIFKDGAE
ncbi:MULTISPECIES: hypothetical protein [unclassified Rathayibacter]|jgi:hypothetical protein|uniref:hypothetical protein n=1 Tax=unclassified Rathayibacter TaxID=2609250 RepID=UPI000CE82B59|nr:MULTISPECIES: hypothetical protein [unclassified Rathayibacter]PPF50136.1 hypothetical protein C5E14_02265 [Rathayibacter sp. AY1A1]PPH01432.1 hypothetical protein C5C32_05845 [Rathayibacter sp. AY1G9]